MNKKSVIAAVVLVTFLATTFYLKTVLRRKDAVKTVNTILTHWKDGDLTLAMSYWKFPEESPPVYDLLSFEVGKGIVEKKDGVYQAYVPVKLEFPEGNQLPSGRKWSFRMAKTRYGWKITEFALSGDKPSP